MDLLLPVSFAFVQVSCLHFILFFLFDSFSNIFGGEDFRIAISITICFGAWNITWNKNITVRCKHIDSRVQQMCFVGYLLVLPTLVEMELTSMG